MAYFDVSINFSVDDNGAGFDGSGDTGIFTYGEGSSIGDDFTVDFAVDNEVVGKFDTAFNFHIGTKDVTSAGAGGILRGGGRR